MFRPRHPLYKQFKHLKGSIICLEGNIGIGKTTLGSKMAALLNEIGLEAQFYTEYVNTELLGQYIGDMAKYAYAFQLFILAKRIESYREAERFAKTGGIAILDRSLFGDQTFAYLQYRNGNMTKSEWDTYCSVAKQEAQLEPTYILYLQCQVKTCQKRIQKRGIQAEIEGYSESYLADLANSYDAMIQGLRCGAVVTLDWDHDRILDTQDIVDVLTHLP